MPCAPGKRSDDVKLVGPTLLYKVQGPGILGGPTSPPKKEEKKIEKKWEEKEEKKKSNDFVLKAKVFFL